MGRRADDLWSALGGLTWVALGLILLIVVAAWLIFRVRAQFHGGADGAGADHGMLSQLGELRRQGQLSEDEYRSIKGRLVQRLDGSIRAQEKHEPGGR